jgi:hypothetical protein
MVDMHERFRRFDEVGVPELWDRIEAMAMVKATPPKRTPRPVAAAVAAAVVVLAAVGGGFLLLRQVAERSPTADPTEPTVTAAPATTPPPAATDAPAAPEPTVAPSIETLAPPPPATPPPAPEPTPAVVAVSNNALGTGPALFGGVDGLPGAFVGGLEFGEPPTPVIDLVRCDDAACASTTTTRLAALGGNAAVEPLVFDDGSLGAIVLTREGDLQLARCSDAACSEATPTRLTDAASTWNAALADDGSLVVLFALPWGESSEPPGTGLVVCPDGTCASGARVTMLGNLWSPDPMYSRLAVSGDRLAFAFRTGDGAVFLGTCGDLSCGDPSTIEVVPPAGDGGWLDVFDLAVGSDGLPVLAHGWMGDPRELRLAHCENWECSERTVETVDELSGGWQGPSLGIGGDGYPVMAYADDGAITVAKCEDARCTSVLVSTPLGATPGDPSLIVGIDGSPVIAYFVVDPDPVGDEANPDAPIPAPVTAFVRCADAACAVPAG